MGIYFFTESYDKNEIGDKLESLGFSKGKPPRNYELEGDLFIVNFTDYTEGRYQNTRRWN